mgnify:CR=1 FL=1
MLVHEVTMEPPTFLALKFVGAAGVVRTIDEYTHEETPPEFLARTRQLNLLLENVPLSTKLVAEDEAVPIAT